MLTYFFVCKLKGQQSVLSTLSLSLLTSVLHKNEHNVFYELKPECNEVKATTLLVLI